MDAERDTVYTITVIMRSKAYYIYATCTRLTYQLLAVQSAYISSDPRAYRSLRVTTNANSPADANRRRPTFRTRRSESAREAYRGVIWTHLENGRRPDFQGILLEYTDSFNIGHRYQRNIPLKFKMSLIVTIMIYCVLLRFGSF